MNNHANLKHKRHQARMQLHKTFIEEGQKLRDLKLQEQDLKKEFLKQWKEYLSGYNQEKFLQISTEYGYLIEKQMAEHKELMKKSKPHYEQIKKLDLLLH